MNDKQLIKLCKSIQDKMHLDIIGHDSCVFATRLLRDSLNDMDIETIPLQTTLVARWSKLEVVLCGPSGPHEFRHAVLGVVLSDSNVLLADLTTGQINELAPEFPKMSGVILPMPNKKQLHRLPCFAGSCTVKPSGVRLTYYVDSAGPMWYEGSDDWTMPRERQELLLAMISTPEGAEAYRELMETEL